MCGIAGILKTRQAPDPVDRETLIRLRDSLLHRGPDGDGLWLSPDRSAGLVHTRLAIIDPTPGGAQPMTSQDGRHRIVFNGEIYNYVELRRELEDLGRSFRTQSDTEILLAAWLEWEDGALDRLDGQFAFAIHDSARHEVVCARDHLGEKPLYIVSTPHQFAFASEVRALVSAGVVDGSIDPRGIGLLLRQGSIPTPWTHIAGVQSLPPATVLRAGPTWKDLRARRYWTIPFAPESTAIQDPDEAREVIRAALLGSIKVRLRADVPVAAFLSGGLDSAAVSALMIEAGAADLSTFTVTMPGQPGDEAAVARSVAAHLGTNHQEIPLEIGESDDWLDAALSAMDVPSNDGPNTWLVSRAVHEAGIKVACSGLGGDELFFGYPSFPIVSRARRWFGWLAPLRKLRPYSRRWMSRLPAVPRWSRVGDGVLSGASCAALWLAKRGLYSEAEVRDILTDSFYEHASDIDAIERIELLRCPPGLHPMRQISFYELSVYMHDQLLRDTDAMSMAHSLEVRVPLIGRRVVEAVAGVGVRGLLGARLKPRLREIVEPLLPAGILDRPKQGFHLNWPRIYEDRATPESPPWLEQGVLSAEHRRLRDGQDSGGRLMTLEAAATTLARRPQERAEDAVAVLR